MKISFVPFLVFVFFNLNSAIAKNDKAVFAGGCFWCMEPPFEKLDGVLSVVSGYTGGQLKNPTYEQVSGGSTGHTEAVQIEFDPKKVTYQKLLDVFWVNVDPTRADGQFCDSGSQYRPEIFYLNADQKKSAEDSMKKMTSDLQEKKPIQVKVTQFKEFFPAEDYHQDYYSKNPIRYKFYRTGCGRDKRLKELWGSKAGSSL